MSIQSTAYERSLISKETLRTLYFLTAALVVSILSMGVRAGPELADDGAFFLRYAGNMLEGEFWVWNLGEPPVWGASAPLYPLVVALPLALGVAPLTALVGTGVVLMSLAIAVAAVTIRARFGLAAAVAFVAFVAFDSGLMYYATAGLESPLTVLLLALAMATLFGNASPLIVGIVAGLLMVQKLDLVPAGGLLILAVWLRDGRLPVKATVIAALLAGAWYVFAWSYFGAPVPNSFLTKSLYQDSLPKAIDWTWFGGYVLIHGLQKWLVILAAVSLLLTFRRVTESFILLGGLLATHLVAYTIKYPFEPYTWYGIPSVFSLAVLGALGFGAFHEAVCSKFKSRALAVGLSALLLAVVFSSSFSSERAETAQVASFTANQEHDRSEAGRWVAANTPTDFKVFTMWGNPAYYSNRYVYDGSFLNRKFEQANLIDVYRPEVVVLQADPGVQPTNPVFPAVIGKGYEVVKVFDKTHAAGMDYFFGVLVRTDVLSKVTGVDVPIDFSRYLLNVQLGDQYGTMKLQGKEYFIHPGANTSTQFDFDLDAYAKDSRKSSLQVSARIAPNVPEDAIKRGGASVKISILIDGSLVSDQIVKVGQPFSARLQVSDGNRVKFIVDNNGSPDTDWLLLSLR